MSEMKKDLSVLYENDKVSTYSVNTRLSWDGDVGWPVPMFIQDEFRVKDYKPPTASATDAQTWWGKGFVVLQPNSEVSHALSIDGYEFITIKDKKFLSCPQDRNQPQALQAWCGDAGRGIFVSAQTLGEPGDVIVSAWRGNMLDDAIIVIRDDGTARKASLVEKRLLGLTKAVIVFVAKKIGFSELKAAV